MGKVLARRLAHSKLCPAVLAFSVLAAPAAHAGELRDNEVVTVRNAIAAAARGNDSSARAVRDVRNANNEVARDVVQWYALQQGSIPATFSTYTNFIREHPDWPRCIEIGEKLQCDELRKQAEARVSERDTPSDVIEFFRAYPPLTLNGINAYAGALQIAGQDVLAREAIKTFWVKGSMPRNEQESFYSRYSDSLNEADREARTFRLLWDAEASPSRDVADGLRSSAKVIIPTLTSAGARALANARIALQTDADNVATLVEAVPDSHANDPGLVYDRARRFAANGNEQMAAQLLLEHGSSTDGRPSSWWKLRDRVARSLLEEGNSPLAYRIVSQHGLTKADEVPYLAAEWTAGWIALRFRGDAATAVPHFSRMYEASTSVISKARGAYWLGRALMAKGEETAGRDWYIAAAQHGTTYYGQLAAHEVYGDVNISPPAAPEPSSQARTAFNRRDMVRAVRVGVEIGNHAVAKAFMNAQADSSRTQDEATLAVQLGAELRRPDLAAWAAKRIGRLGYAVPKEGYPVLRYTVPGEPEPELIHSITRQESTFYQHAKSGAGALGLMQLLPATANEQARKLGIQNQTAWLTSKPEHNLRLGSAYLAGRIDGFGGSYILGIAAYNGGPGNASRWEDRFGPPGNLLVPTAARPGETALWKTIDWVELIPFSETREYVQYVLAGTEVYRAVLHKGQQPARLQLRQNLMR